MSCLCFLGFHFLADVLILIWGRGVPPDLSEPLTPLHLCPPILKFCAATKLNYMHISKGLLPAALWRNPII